MRRTAWHARTPKVLRCAWNHVGKQLCAKQPLVHCEACRAMGEGAGERTSILMRPALCPPIETSKNTTGLPPAAPGIEPRPDIQLTRRKKQDLGAGKLRYPCM